MKWIFFRVHLLNGYLKAYIFYNWPENSKINLLANKSFQSSVKFQFYLEERKQGNHSHPRRENEKFRSPSFFADFSSKMSTSAFKSTTKRTPIGASSADHSTSSIRSPAHQRSRLESVLVPDCDSGDRSDEVVPPRGRFINTFRGWLAAWSSENSPGITRCIGKGRSV